MGNCCGGGSSSDKETQNLTNAGGTNTRNRNAKAFHGEGHRLGTAADTALPRPAAASTPMQRDDDGMPQPIHDENLTEEERARIRADRAAAAEARLLKQGGGATPKKKKAGNNSAPLTGPNSQPAMRWTAG